MTLCLSYRTIRRIIANPLLNTHCVVRSLSLALFLGSSCWHLLSVAIWNVDEHTRTLLTAVGTADTTSVNKTVIQKNGYMPKRCFGTEQIRVSTSLPEWLIRLVTDVEAPPLELDDVTFLQVLQTGVTKHLFFQLRSKTDNKITTSMQYNAHTEQITDLAMFINVVLEVVVFGDDSFGDEWLIVDADGWHREGIVCFSQPSDLCCLLVVFVVQIQACLHGQNLSISPSK